MEQGGLLFTAFIYLIAAVCSVPIAKRLGLGSVLGYLIAGVLIGPHVLGLVGEQTGVMHFAEFGVVMMLFLVGLELRPSRVWQLRGPILGMGGLQVLITAALIGGLSLLAQLDWRMALTAGLILAMSSTAIVLQSLDEQGLMNSNAGQSAFSVLLFQDIAVIPILALLPLLAMVGGDGAGDAGSAGAGLSGWRQALAIVAFIAAIILAGRFLMRPVLRFVAETRLREIFTASALLLVIGVALAMQFVGLSPALGTFLAGVVLADSEYRHELESDIEPFKGLLLGLFFISVGASIDVEFLLGQPFQISGMVAAVVLVKFAALFLIGLVFRMPTSETFVFSFSLAQGGEFAFVLLAFAVQNNVLTAEITGSLVLVVALSMVLSPLLMIVNEKLVQPRFVDSGEQREADHIDSQHNPVIIAGFGRFGQIVGRLLLANRVRVTVLDYDAAHIDTLRKFGFKVFYGDASRPELLRAAGAEQARILVVAVDERDKTQEIIAQAQRHFPRLRIMARAVDRVHAYELINLGADAVYRETFGTALDMGVDTLKQLGMRAYQAIRAGRSFRRHDEQSIPELAVLRHDQALYLSRRNQLRDELERMLEMDQEEESQQVDKAWDALAPDSRPPDAK